MGFGLIFIGYSVMFVMPISIFPSFIGLFMIMRGVRRLLPYSNKFAHAYNAFFILSIYSAMVTFLAIGEWLNIPFLTIDTVSLVKIGEWVGMAIAHFFLFAGLTQLSRDVGVKRIAEKLSRNLFFTISYISVQVILDLIRPPIPMPLQSLNILTWSIIVIMNSVQIFSCYMRICYEGDEYTDDPKPKQVRRHEDD
ncbi:MAG: hypothetical protein FWB93_01765 [Oscillospiraceae bacterium]|nr:hypothetical protein [Oscillospiraceae bacterium]